MLWLFYILVIVSVISLVFSSIALSANQTCSTSSSRLSENTVESKIVVDFPLLAPLSAPTAPSYSFDTNPTTGLGATASDVYLSITGTKSLSLTSSTLYTPDQINFLDETTTGIQRTAASTISTVIAGTNIASFTSTGLTINIDGDATNPALLFNSGAGMYTTDTSLVLQASSSGAAITLTDTDVSFNCPVYRRTTAPPLDANDINSYALCNFYNTGSQFAGIFFPAYNTIGFAGGVTTSKLMFIDANGGVYIGGADTSTNTVTNTSILLELAATTKCMRLTRQTTAEIAALTPLLGMLTYDSTLNKLKYYDGTIWNTVSDEGIYISSTKTLAVTGSTPGGATDAVALGSGAGIVANAVNIGYQAGDNISGSGVQIGYQAGRYGTSCVQIGYQAGGTGTGVHTSSIIVANNSLTNLTTEYLTSCVILGDSIEVIDTDSVGYIQNTIAIGTDLRVGTGSMMFGHNLGGAAAFDDKKNYTWFGKDNVVSFCIDATTVRAGIPTSGDIVIPTPGTTAGDRGFYLGQSSTSPSGTFSSGAIMYVDTSDDFYVLTYDGIATKQPRDHTATVQWRGALTSTSANQTLYIVAIGQFIILTIPAYAGAANSSDVIDNTGTELAAAYRPATQISQPCIVQDNSATVSGTVTISTGGVITFTVGISSNFTASGNAGPYGMTVQYLRA